MEELVELEVRVDNFKSRQLMLQHVDRVGGSHVMSAEVLREVVYRLYEFLSSNTGFVVIARNV